MAHTLEDAIEQSHRALAAIIRGDPRGFRELFADREDVTLGNPFGPYARGSATVAATLANAASRYKDYAEYAGKSTKMNPPWKNQTLLGYTITDQPENHPVINMTRENATAFCEWLSRNEGRTYRLPTDEEWSIAARAGRKVATFPWGESYPPPQGTAAAR